MRNGKLAALALAALVLTGAVSCNIKEQRIGCPTYVTVKSDGHIHEGHSGNVAVSIFLGDDQSLSTYKRENVTLSDFKKGKYTVQIPRGRFLASGLGGRKETVEIVSDLYAAIPYGCQSDSLCAFCKDVTLGEADDYYVVEGPLHKQFCTLTMRTPEVTSYSFRITGDWSGFSLVTMEPLEGEFRYDMMRDYDNLYRARLPRQGDSTLRLEVWSGRYPGTSYGRLLKTLDLGEMIEMAGYSWSEESLADVNLDFTWSSGQVTVYVNDWKNGKTFSFRI